MAEFKSDMEQYNKLTTDELVKLENEIQDGNQKLRAVLDVIRKIALDKDVPKDISNNLIDTLDNLYGN